MAGIDDNVEIDQELIAPAPPLVIEGLPEIGDDTDLPDVVLTEPEPAPQEPERVVLALPTGEDVQRLVGSSADEELLGNDENNVLVGRAGSDALFGFNGNDRLVGGNGDDFLYGGEGIDRLIGGRGADFLDGGDGAKDHALYHNSDAGVTVDLLAGTGFGGHAEGDTLVNIERITGSAFNDILGGDENDNVLNGRDGDDLIDGGVGNDTLNGGNGDDVLSGGDGRDNLFGGAGADLLDGGEGDKDRANYRHSEEGVTVDLASGTGSGGDAEGDILFNIEQIQGSEFNDTLVGDDADNRLIGRDGDDLLSGGNGKDALVGGNGNDTLAGDAGDDFLNGGNGDDTLLGGDGRDNLLGGAGADVLDGGAGDLDRANYRHSEEGVTVDLAAGTGSGGDADGDTLVNIEQVLGSEFDDTIIGDDANNRLIGRDGEDHLEGGAGDDVLLGGNDDDVLVGGAGNDRLNGQDGDRDTVDYTASEEGIDVNLTTTRGFGGDAEGDRIFNVEDIRGSDFNDVLTGADGVNRLAGNEGDDELIGMGGNDMLLGGEGADIINGGEGIDTANYQHADEGVGVNLATGGFAGEATGDTFIDVEFFYGSEFNDTAIGDDLANRLNGQLGDDVLNGAGGRDTLIGDLGNDTLTGGDDLDLFLFRGAFGNDVITDFEAGEGIVDRIFFQGLGLSDSDLTFTDGTDGLFIEAGTYGTLLLEGVQAIDLAADDFIF